MVEKKDAVEEASGDPIEQLKGLGIPLGWKECIAPIAWTEKIIGLLLTAFAVSLGAPFWFDMLKKVINIRASGAAPTTPPQKANN